ncbi:sialate O-acetylesterase [Wenyingzhuangia sp. IMCC45533]
MMNFTPKQILLFFTLLLTGLSSNYIFAQSKPINIVLFAGQSNMAGRGVFSELDKDTAKRIEKISDRVTLVIGAWRTALSYNPRKEHTEKFGPEMFIGLHLAEKYPDQEFLFIKTSVGGTSLHGAWSPQWTQEKANASEFNEARKKMKLYAEHTNKIRKEIERLEKEGKSYKIIGMFWMQGERDTRLELSATNYEENLENLINSYREEFDVKCMPFVFGQVNNVKRSSREFEGGIEMVRTAMENVNKKVKYTAMVPTSMDPSWSDYPKLKDDTHYTTEGQKRLGTAMYEAFYQLKH